MTSLEIVAAVAQPDELLALGVEHRADHLLVLARAVLVVLAVLRLARARGQPPAAVLVRPCASARRCPRASSPRRRARRSASSAASTAARRPSSSSRSSAPSSRTPRRRISAGSVSPCRTSVVKITANVMSRTTSRCGKSARQRERRGERHRAAHARPARRSCAARQSARRSRCCGRRSSARMTNGDRCSPRRCASRITVTLIADRLAEQRRRRLARRARRGSAAAAGR